MKLNLTRPLAFIDLETTGVNVGHDRIVELSILKMKPDGTREVLTKRVNPTIPIPEHVIAIHGITNEAVKDEPSFAELAKSIANFLKDCDLAGYNSNKFDIPLLMEEFLRAEVDFDLKNRKLIDVQNIFHKMEPRTLAAAYKFYCQKELVNAHSAEADITATFEVLIAQLEKYQDVELEDKKGIFNDQNIETFNFGKYKGKSVEEIFAKEPSYYDWMMKSEFPLYTKKVITAIKLRGFNKGSINFG